MFVGVAVNMAVKLDGNGPPGNITDSYTSHPGSLAVQVWHLPASDSDARVMYEEAATDDNASLVLQPPRS